MAMVRTGEARLSSGSALMIACPAEQGSDQPGPPESQAGYDRGPSHTVTPVGAALPVLVPQRTDISRAT